MTSAQRGIDVREVRTRADRDLFVKLPWRLYRGDPHWVPPLLRERKEFLSRTKNPFYDFGDIVPYLAFLEGEPVGRIAAIEDRNHNAFHRSNVGAFGFLECVDRPDVAAALFDAALGWCRQRGHTSIWGPVSPSPNYECGLLVDGFHDRPAILMTYNPPYYEKLVLAAGFRKARDLWAWTIAPPEYRLPDNVARVAERARRREGVTIRPIRMHRLAEELQRLASVYNEAWGANWGFAPMTSREFAKMAEDLKPIVVPELILLAEVGDEPVAFALTLPDFNEVLAKVNGRLWPFGIFKLFWYSRGITRVRMAALGVRAAYRRRGIDALLCAETLRVVHLRGYQRGEISWTLEDNGVVNRTIMTSGGTRYKTYRLYDRDL